MTPEECAAKLAGVAPARLEATLASVIAEILDWTSNPENAAELIGLAFAGAGRPHVVVEARGADTFSIHDQRPDGLYAEVAWTRSPHPEDDDAAWIVKEPGGYAVAELVCIGREG